MGSIYSALSSGSFGVGKKRSADEDRDDELLQTPKRRKLNTTSDYIYQALFLDGESSDIRISCLGRDWLLHKVYLCQSKYFQSMFSGSWKESKLTSVNIDIPDPTINETAMQLAFGSLYHDSIEISPIMVVPVVAAASLLQLEGLIAQCEGIMLETITLKTVCNYYSASMTYGLISVSDRCIEWLERNIMVLRELQDYAFFRDMSVELMTRVIASPNLYVVQVEMDVYTLLKKWVFLKLNQTWQGDRATLMKNTDSFFTRVTGSGSRLCFLETDDGRPFETAFQNVRIQHIVIDQSSLDKIQNERIIPSHWVQPVISQQWLKMLKVEEGQDSGPENISLDDFQRQCIRCGRVLNTPTEYCWRWTGYNYGIDIIVIYANRLIILKRNTQDHSTSHAVSLQDQRNVVFQMTAMSLDQNGNLTYSKETQLTCKKFSKDQERIVMLIDRQASFPLHIKMKLLTVSAASSSQSSHDSSDAGSAEIIPVDPLIWDRDHTD